MTIQDFFEGILDYLTSNPIYLFICLVGTLLLGFLIYKLILKQLRKRKVELTKRKIELARINKEERIKIKEAEKRQDEYIEKQKRRKLEKELEVLKASTKAGSSQERDLENSENVVGENQKDESKNIIIKSTDDDKIEKNRAKHLIVSSYLSASKVEIIEKISLPLPNSSRYKRIGYLPNNEFKQIEPYNYAVVKMPKENSVIKFPRKGRSEKKGFTEDAFYSQLNKYFKPTFNVYNDKHIPFNKVNYYEPDFVLSNENNGKNIFINVEIDEPYDGWSRIPIHCIGENEIRDNFFLKNGWIVIRFAEIQVHCQPEKCCSLIAKVIKSIDATFDSELLLHNKPDTICQWNKLDAEKMAKSKYREKYLNILDFPMPSNAKTVFTIKEFDEDLPEKEESPKKLSDYKHNNEPTDVVDERDRRIQFDPIEHRYTIDNNPDTISVTQLIDKFFPEFNPSAWSRPKAIEKLALSGQALTEENIHKMQKIIEKEWNDKGIQAANEGTLLHQEIENYYKGKNYNSNTKEFQHFLAFKQQYPNMIKHRSEWRIFDEDLMVAGTIDMAYRKDDGSFYIFDWKRSKKVVNLDGSVKDDRYQYAIGELNHLGDNSYNKYCLQQNIYKSILEKRYKLKISTMNLLILHENYDTYIHKTVPNMDKEVSYIFSNLLSIKK